MKDQRTRFDLTQDGLVIGEKLQRIYPDFDVDVFVADVRYTRGGEIREFIILPTADC